MDLDERIHTHGVEPILSDGSTLSILAGIALGPSDVAPEVIAIDRCHTLPVCGLLIVFVLQEMGDKPS